MVIQKASFSYHSFYYPPEDNMLPIEPRCFHSCNEELRPVSVLPSVGHAQITWSLVLQLEVLILEFIAVNTLA